MKKLSIIMLALALALVMSVPAMAIHVGDDDSPEGSLGLSGRYQFDGEARDVDGAKTDFYDDDLDLSFTMIKGDVKAFVGMEISDMNPVQGSLSGEGAPGQRGQLIDNYYVEWSAMDNLKVKIGEYGLPFGKQVGTYTAGARNIQLTYSMDALDISGAIMKEVDDAANSEDDDDTLYIKVSGKEAGPFTKLDLASYTQMNDVNAAENSLTRVDAALPIGPISLEVNYGANGGDLDGEWMFVGIGLDFLEAFDVNVNYFSSSDDYLVAYDLNNWSPVAILGDNINEGCYDMSVIWLEATYDVNDKLRVGGQVVVSAENDAGDAYGTEVDLGLKYKIADNITYAAAYATYSEGDGVTVPFYKAAASGDDVDATEMWHRIEFKF
jgi:hypothetical protein